MNDACRACGATYLVNGICSRCGAENNDDGSVSYGLNIEEQIHDSDNRERERGYYYGSYDGQYHCDGGGLW